MCSVLWGRHVRVVVHPQSRVHFGMQVQPRARLGPPVIGGPAAPQKERAKEGEHVRLHFRGRIRQCLSDLGRKNEGSV